MGDRHSFIKSIFIYFFACSGICDAQLVTWVAQDPDNNMNDTASWEPSSVPISSDDANFNSTLSGISTNPTSTTVPFSISTINFTNNASIFNFSFNNSSLTFNGVGLTGSNTNCAIQIANIDNEDFIFELISFLGSSASSGNSLITISNSANLTGNQSDKYLGSIDSHLYSSGPFLIGNGGEITATNIGINNATGTGNNKVAFGSCCQMTFDQTFTGLNDVSVSVANTGLFNGSNTVNGESVGVVLSSQFRSGGAFQVGNTFSCDIQNIGFDSSSGIGFNSVGQIGAPQIDLQSTANVGDDCSISISNVGFNTSEATNFANSVGYLNDQQLYVANSMNAGNDFNLTVNNIGLDVSSGYGNGQVAVINSNSGITGNQVHFVEGGTFGDRAEIIISNAGLYLGTNTNKGPNVAIMNLEQIAIGDSNAPGSFALNAGNDFSLNVSCQGSDNGQGLGFEAVGVVSTDQIALYAPCTLGNNANITVNKSGAFTGVTSSSYVNVGSAGGSQLNSRSTFQAGENFTLTATNGGIHEGTGLGSDFIGDLITGQQVAFQQGLTIGNNAHITISNNGLNSSNTSNANQVGSLMGYGKQLFIKELFLTGNNLSLTISNSGFDDSLGAGGSYVGFINNNVADHSASQLHLDAEGVVGNQATIILNNEGTFEGSNTSGANVVGVLAGQQFYVVSDFEAGDNFKLTTSNKGKHNASNQSNHTIGQIGEGGQFECGGSCILGDDASINLSNSGINNDLLGTSNRIGCVMGSQMKVTNAFSSGKNLQMNANNIAVNSGDASNFVGHVSGSQFFFAQSCTLEDNSHINAYNSGTIEGSQILFSQGFNIANGKSYIQAINEGTFGSYGINIQGNSSGGNAEIILGNTTLYIETILPTFTIGGLNGDATSIAQSLPSLIINTNTATQTEFAGVIQDFPEMTSSLIKTGLGTQTLSGANTYTGLTEVQEGTLILTGSLSGDAQTNTNGTLKGGGTINGAFINNGTVAPGESIGTLTVVNYVNNGGTYEVEVNGAGQSDLIHALNTATINGGTVVVSSVDGTFRIQQPYTIVTADGGVIGQYTGASSSAFINPILSYDPNNVYLTLESALLNAAESCNQFGVARVFDSIVNPSDEQSLFIGSIANLPLEEAQQALESLSGFQYTNDVWLAEISIRKLLRRLYDPLRALISSCNCCDGNCNRWTAWLETGGGCTSLQGKNGHHLHANSYQLTGGIQKNFSTAVTLGLAGSYEYSHVNLKKAKENSNAAFLSAYGLYKCCSFYGLVDLVYGHFLNNVSRRIVAGNVSYNANGKPNLNAYAFYGEMGFDVKGSCFLIQPFLGLQLGKNCRSHFKENESNGFGLAIHKHDWSSKSTRLGLHVSTCQFCNSIDFSLDVAWNQLLSSKNKNATGRFREFGDSFRICGNHLDKSSVDYALSLNSCSSECLRGYFRIGGEWWCHAHTLEALAGLEYSW